MMELEVEGVVLVKKLHYLIDGGQHLQMLPQQELMVVGLHLEVVEEDIIVRILLVQLQQEVVVLERIRQLRLLML